MSREKALLQEAKLKTALVLDGNVRDEFYSDKFAKDGYMLLPAYLNKLFDNGDWEMVLRWDPSTILEFNSQDDAKKFRDLLVDTYDEEDDFDMGGELDVDIPKESKLDFNALIDQFSTVSSKTYKPLCLIINWSDYQFNPVGQLQDADRAKLIKLGKYSTESSIESKIRSSKLSLGRSTIIFLTSKISDIPFSFYQPDSRVKVLTIPYPNMNDRREFILRHFDDFVLAKNDESRTRADIADDLSAMTDGYTLMDLKMILELSNQVEKPYDATKLVSLYKFGDKDSPWEQLTDAKLKKLKDELNGRVIGQEDAVDHVVTTIIKASLGISGLQHSATRTKPKGSLFFTGPTGVGKTELAKAVAKFLFGDESAFIRFDMSEYTQEESDQRLIGAPPGFVGFENGGQLTNAVMEKPFSVILFDEIEKAHPRIFDKFLGILEDGRLTDGRGETAYFSETLIIFTSNLGASDESSGKKDLSKRENRISHYTAAIEDHFVNKLGRPEILNRIGENVVIFNSITSMKVKNMILKKKLKPLQDFIKEKFGTSLELSDDILGNIVKTTDPKYGGRGILNRAESVLINPLTEFLFKNKSRLNDERFISTKIVDGNIVFEIEEK